VATIAPLGWKDRPCNTLPLVCIRSRQGPSYFWCGLTDQDCQSATVASTVAAKSDFEPDVGRYLRQSGAIKGEMDGLAGVQSHPIARHAPNSDAG